MRTQKSLQGVVFASRFERKSTYI